VDTNTTPTLRLGTWLDARGHHSRLSGAGLPHGGEPWQVLKQHVDAVETHGRNRRNCHSVLVLL